GVASTAPSAGFEPTRRACAAALAGRASARRTATRLQSLRQDELEKLRTDRSEPAPAVESGGALVPHLDDDLQTGRAGRDRIALRPVEQLATDPLFLVSRMHAELFDAEGGIGFLDRDEAGIPPERVERAALVGLCEGQLRDPEQQPLILVSEGPHHHLAVRHLGARCYRGWATRSPRSRSSAAVTASARSGARSGSPPSASMRS